MLRCAYRERDNTDSGGAGSRGGAHRFPPNGKGSDLVLIEPAERVAVLDVT
jgi:hypothetical protein